MLTFVVTCFSFISKRYQTAKSPLKRIYTINSSNNVPTALWHCMQTPVDNLRFINKNQRSMPVLHET